MPTRLIRGARRLTHWIRDPELPGRAEANQAAWERLPAQWRVPEQVFGRQQPGCAATYHVVERCNFSCSACYLANTANSVPPLPFEEVKEQLDAIRAFLGPWGTPRSPRARSRSCPWRTSAESSATARRSSSRRWS